MRAPRSLLLLLGGTALVVGAALALGHYSVPLGDLMSPRVRGELRSAGMRSNFANARVPCARPISGAFQDLFDDQGESGGWFNYAPNSRVTFSPAGKVKDRVPCTTSARWRLGGGLALVLAGAAALVVWTRQSLLGREADHDVTPSDPPSTDDAPGQT
jgi:hypothetical protein